MFVAPAAGFAILGWTSDVMAALLSQDLGLNGMASDPEKPSRQDEAAKWFAAERAGVMLVEQRAEFDAWKADPRNLAALEAMREFWDDLAILKGRAPEPQRTRRPARRAALIAVAALAVFVIAGMVTAGLLLPRGTEITTIAGQQTTQSMPDGSVIAVNVASNLTYAVTAEERRVTLGDGEAAFSVRPEPARPFIVRAGNYEIRTLGTSFNVRQRDGQLEIAVSEGKVSICRAGRADLILASLVAGQLLEIPAAVSSTASLPAPEPVPAGQISEWRMRIVTYEDATVRDVVRDFNRYFSRKLLVKDPELLERRVTIRLQVEDRDRALGTLAGLLDARVVGEGGEDLLIT